MLFAEDAQRAEHWPKLIAFGGEDVFRTWRMMLVQPPLDDAVPLQAFEPG